MFLSFPSLLLNILGKENLLDIDSFHTLLWEIRTTRGQ